MQGVLTQNLLEDFQIHSMQDHASVHYEHMNHAGIKVHLDRVNSRASSSKHEGGKRRLLDIFTLLVNNRRERTDGNQLSSSEWIVILWMISDS